MNVENLVNNDNIYSKDEFMVLKKIDLSEYSPKRSKSGLGGLAASNGVGWVNVLDGLPQSGHCSTSQAAIALDVTLQLVYCMFHITSRQNLDPNTPNLNPNA